MLDALRRGSTGMVAKALFGILVASFAIWGIGPVFRNFGRGALAKVGPHEIRAEDFQRSLQNEIRAISRQTGRHITPEQAHAAGIDQRVLAQLMAWAAVETHADQLNLALSDKALIDGLKTDPAFKDPSTGSFSRITFDNVLQGMGLSERGFLALRRRDELREQVTAALMNGIAIPDQLVDLVNSWRNEKRVAQYFIIDADKAVKVPEPDDAKLRETFDANKGEFTSPEYRKLGVLILSVDDLKNKMEVTDAEISANYEETQKDYNTPERRRLQQISFKDKAAAQAAKAALAGGKTFGEVAKDAGAKDSDIDLGLIAKDRLIDPKIAEAAFALPKDGVSDPIEGRFTTVLVRVSAIEPAVNRSLADVKEQVHDKLAKAKAQSQIQTLLDQVEDGRSAGKPLKDIAEQMKLQYLEVPSTDRSNKTPAGAPAVGLPDAQAIVKTGFETQVGLQNEALELHDGGYAWVDVLGTTDKKQKPFDEVKELVKALAIAKERDRLITELANKLVEKANTGADFAALATEAGGAKVETTLPFTRTTEAQGLPKDAVARAFTLAKDKAASSPTNDTRIVYKVTEITPAPEPTKEQRETIAKSLKNELTDEVLSQYIVALEDRLGAHINPAEYKRATGSESDTETQ
jgi:peptidyl-prolyl cis-trans isomerase D